jgi:hypothetical protein
VAHLVQDFDLYPRHIKVLESRSQLLDISTSKANRQWEGCRMPVDQLGVTNAAICAALTQVLHGTRATSVQDHPMPMLMGLIFFNSSLTIRVDRFLPVGMPGLTQEILPKKLGGFQLYREVLNGPKYVVAPMVGHLGDLRSQQARFVVRTLILPEMSIQVTESWRMTLSRKTLCRGYILDCARGDDSKQAKI